MSEHHEGGCLCGSVRYRVEGNPLAAIACHCKLCQLRTGSAFGIGAYFDKSRVKILKGGLKAHKYHSDEDGKWIQIEFCSNCGSTITWTLEMAPDFRAIAGGSFDDPNWFQVTKHAWTRSAHHWMVYPTDAEVFERTALG